MSPNNLDEFFSQIDVTSAPPSSTSMVRAEEINMENQEDVLDALCCYEKKPTPDIPPVLDQYLRRVAKTGETLFPWQQLKILFIHKLDSVITQFNQDFPADHLQNCPNVENVKFEEMKKRVVCSLEEFQGAPFTIQRLCELVTEPKKHYKRTDKFLRGIEKNVLVVSTVDPFGRKIVSDSRPMMNGLDMNGYNGNRPENKPHFSSFPSPSSQQTTWPSDRVFSPELSKELSNPLYETDVSPSPNFPPSEGERVQPTLERVEQQTSPQIKSQENVTLPTENMVKTDTSSESLPPDATPSTTGTSDVNTSLRGSDLSEKMMTSEQSNVEPEVKDVQQSSDAVHSTNTTPLDTTCVDNNSKPSNPQSQEREEEDLSVSGDAQDSDQISSSSSLPLSSSPEPIKEPEESASKESELTNVTTSDDTSLEGSANEPASLSVSQDTTSNDSADCAVCVESSTDSVNDTPSVELPLAQSSTVQLDSTTGEDDMETDSTIPSSDSVVDSDQSEKDESQTNNEKESNCEEEVKVESESSSGASEPVATPMEQD
ncbi:serine/threonine-protein phosphatase 4 regulatory subunit 2-A-like [Ylistrum balloti]|uniref:serine/threonine-protein phosphatase 4 regulatory subunit 2-A-like n=1 Tax=Ylistrum balloti TaxID=509963 RepID=UPI002905D7E9|nr:serine/threonine-protein phosphatase 4 regulatory subunit 2-A-like [Ylistrum balloti]